VLPVEVDEQSTDLREDRRTHRGAVDPGPRAAVRDDLALEHDQRLVGVDAPFVEQRGDLRALGDVEHSLDRGAVRAGPDEIRARALPEQQAQRAHDDRLAGARLARQHVEPGPERQRERLDDREVANAKLRQHRCGSSRSSRPPHCSFWRMVAKKLPSGKRTT
jgi:hypothetical protein